MDRTQAADVVGRSADELLRRGNRKYLYGKLLEAAGIHADDAVYPVLCAVAEHAPVRVAEVAAAVGVGPTTGSRHLSELERAGLIRRMADASDARASLVELTTAGKRAVGKIGRARAAMFADLLAGWPDRDVSRFGVLLERFVGVLAEHRERGDQ
jgi:DNA-binding MarR family transcriptional regulator